MAQRRSASVLLISLSCLLTAAVLISVMGTSEGKAMCAAHCFGITDSSAFKLCCYSYNKRSGMVPFEFGPNGTPYVYLDSPDTSGSDDRMVGSPKGVWDSTTSTAPNGLTTTNRETDTWLFWSLLSLLIFGFLSSNHSQIIMILNDGAPRRLCFPPVNNCLSVFSCLV